MIEALKNWNKYMINNEYLTQRGGTFIIEKDNTISYVYKSTSLLSYSLTMNNPLEFLGDL